LLSEEPKDFHANGWPTQFSPDGAILAVTGHDQRVRIWELNRQASFDLPGDADCRGLRFSADGSRLVTIHSVNNRPLLRVWEIASRRELFALKDFAEGDAGGYGSADAVFSADGRRLFTSGDGTVKIWDAVQGHLLLTQRSAFSPVRLSADETRLVAGGPQGATLIWIAPRR
jgi:WD40 repeat protein